LLRAFGPLEREGPSRAFTGFFAGRCNAPTTSLPQPLPLGSSLPPLSTVPLSRKGNLPPPPPSLGALLRHQAQLHHTIAGLATPSARSPYCAVLPVTRLLAGVHHSCYGHLVLEVNCLVNTSTCTPSAQIIQGTAAAAWLLCSLCAVAPLLCSCSMPRVLHRGWPAVKVGAGAGADQPSMLGLGQVCCKPAPCVGCGDCAAHDCSGVCICLCTTQQCTSQSRYWPAAAGSRGPCESPSCKHQHVQGTMCSSTVLFPDSCGLTCCHC
jgi:hypothetical protein